ncbi:MAG TPA: tetratricopeptide repeat protein [Pyrinomonadaceae bacterium]|jgi:tetratricopeptide (TPR) repeat protein
MNGNRLRLVSATIFVLLVAATLCAQQTAEEYLKRGKELLAKKEYLQARESFERAVELAPASAEAYYFRGQVQLDDQKAVADYTKAIELKPDYAEAYFQRGLQMDLSNQRAAALQNYNKALELNPNFLDALRSRAVLYLLDKKNKLALADYTKIIELKPDGESYYMRGNSYLEIGDPTKAIVDLTRSIQLDPTYYWTYKQRAKAYRQTNKLRLRSGRAEGSSHRSAILATGTCEARPFPASD